MGRTALATVILLGAMTLLGPRSGDVSAEGDGYWLSVQHPSVTRGGLAVHLAIEVEHPGGFSDPIEIQIDRDLINRLDFQNWWPNPDSETGSPDFVSLTFEPPTTNTFMTTLDTRTSPAENGSYERYRIAVVENDQEIVGAEFTMAVLP